MNDESQLPITFKTTKQLHIQDVLELYNDAGWKIYTSNPQNLVLALENSLFVLTAYHKNKLVALLRAVGDDQTIIYIQDILVLRQYRKKGIGLQLMQMTLEKYKKIRQIVLLTDDRAENKIFYEKNGLKNSADLKLTSFVRIS